MPLTELVHYFNKRNRLAHPESQDGCLEISDGRVQARFAGRVLGTLFQPVVDSASGRTIGHEATLAVLNGGPEGVPAQAVFLDCRDDTELVFLDRLCRTLHALNFLLEREQKGAFLSLNVHSRLLQAVQGSHGHVFEAILSRCGLTPDRIVLEISDDGFGDPLVLARAIAEYRERGYRIAIDNFGRHSADLERLELLAPDIVKLDSSLIGHAGHLSLAQRVLMALVTEFRRTGMVAVCQWIENPLQLQVARDAGAGWLQGRLLGAPALHCLPVADPRRRREREAA